jgi:hypothetical protein
MYTKSDEHSKNKFENGSFDSYSAIKLMNNSSTIFGDSARDFGMVRCRRIDEDS